jgi:uroporphyrinogen III methyltransferase / synthase
MSEGPRQGKVYLVGAGPGDPQLITVKGQRVLASADSILYDNLAPHSLLDLAPPSAERLYVGKKATERAYQQEEISAMLVERARKGMTVVRLKGGDPFIFGRGGEELEALAAAGVPFEVVPGVTSALGIGAYTGVPLTHRDHVSAVTFVTGHDADRFDWSRIGADQTLVLYMGLMAFPEIARRLIESGRSPDTPAMAVRWGTRPDQKTITGTLATLPAILSEQRLKPPATIVVGGVVGLRDRLNWYERLPLFGRRIVITRDRSQAGDLAAKLRALGAEPLELPVIEIRPATDTGPLDRAIAELETYHWIIFTSVNGVRFFLDRLDHSHRDLRALKAQICAIGPATRNALEQLHLKVDIVPEEYVAESLVAAFETIDLSGKRVLLPRAAVARDLVPERLSMRGARLDVVEAYRTVVPEEAQARAREVFGESRRPHWITFTSSSTVNNFLAVAGREALQGVRIASIGPVTTGTARSHGLQVDVQASPFTIDGLVTAIIGLESRKTRPA